MCFPLMHLDDPFKEKGPYSYSRDYVKHLMTATINQSNLCIKSERKLQEKKFKSLGLFHLYYSWIGCQEKPLKLAAWL